MSEYKDYDGLVLKSKMFPPTEGDTELSRNPGVYGESIANFVKQHLSIYGYNVEQPVMEDFGCVVALANFDFSVSVLCGTNTNVLPEDVYLCCLSREDKTFFSWRKLRFVNPFLELRRLRLDLYCIFSATSEVEIIHAHETWKNGSR